RHTRFSRDWSSDVCSSDLSLPRTRSKTFRLLSGLLRYSDVSIAPHQISTDRLFGVCLIYENTICGHQSSRTTQNQLWAFRMNYSKNLHYPAMPGPRI